MAIIARLLDSFSTERYLSKSYLSRLALVDCFSFAVQLRRRVCMSLFNTLMKKNEQLFPKSEKFAFIYDCGNSLYTKRQLPIEAGDGILRLELLPVGVICCVS